MSDAPRWDLLPNDPRGFFELPPRFDEKQLRRSYNRWLRIFKPERHPEEFQRLRQAYEQLRDELRYFDDAARDAIELVAPPDETGSESAAAPAAPPPPGWQQLLTNGPEATFAALRERHPRTPEDCVRLALLADVVDSEDRGTFAEWLFEGLRIAPRRLMHLAHAWCQTEEAHAAAETLLPALAELGDPVLFAFVGDRLLREHLRRVPFDRFAKRYADCLRRLGADHHPAIVALRLSILRSAVFVADDEWLDAQWGELSRVDHGPHALDLDEELAFVDLLLEYRAVREPFRRRGALTQQIDSALMALAHGGHEGDRARLELQLSITEHAADMLRQFGPGDELARTALAPLDLHARRGESLDDDSQRAERLRRARELSNRMDNTARRSPTAIAAVLTMLLVTLSWLWAIAATGVLIGATEPPMWARLTMIAVAALLGLCVTLWATRHPRGLRHKLQRLVYRRLLRAEIADFVVRNQLPYDDMWRALVAVNAPLQMHGQYALPFATRDVAIAWLSFAQRLP